MRVTFWSEHSSTALIVEHDGGKLCFVTQHPANVSAADVALAEAAEGADLLIFTGAWEHGLALKEQANAKLLAVRSTDSGSDPTDLATAAAKKSANVFFAPLKLRLDL
jgi:hypothetical protein